MEILWQQTPAGPFQDATLEHCLARRTSRRLGSYRRPQNPMKLPGKRSQPYANHAEMNQRSQVGDEPDDGQNQQAHQQP